MPTMSHRRATSKFGHAFFTLGQSRCPMIRAFGHGCEVDDGGRRTHLADSERAGFQPEKAALQF